VRPTRADAAVLTVFELLWQFATAGQMVGPIHNRGARELGGTRR
jgi:hypothetical protein